MWDGKTMVRTFRKKYITVVCASVFSMVGMWAGEGHELFLRANNYYAEKDYDSALKTYEMITDKGCSVLYNMGNCYFNMQNYPYALVYWSRAENGANNQEYNRIQHNKQLAFAALGKQKKEAWYEYIAGAVTSHLPQLSLFFLQLFFLICWFLLILGMRKKQTGRKRYLKGIVSLCVLTCAVFLGVHYKNNDVHSAIVVKKDAKIFSGPDKSFHVLSSAAYADCAAVKETRMGWYKIQYADMIGWVESDVIQII